MTAAWMGNYSYQFFLLLWCTFYQIGNKKLDPLDAASWAAQTCYDNTYADLVLNDGSEPPGIYGYYDLFTWAGWWEVWMLSAFLNFIENFIFATTLALSFIFYEVLIGPETPWCTTGETTSMLVAFNQELCFFTPPTELNI